MKLNNCQTIIKEIQDNLHSMPIPYSHSFSDNHKIILTMASGRKYMIEVRLMK